MSGLSAQASSSRLTAAEGALPDDSTVLTGSDNAIIKKARYAINREWRGGGHRGVSPRPKDELTYVR